MSSAVTSMLMSPIADSRTYTSMYADEIFGYFHWGVCPGAV